MRILYGTGNPAKLAAMRRRLSGMELEILGIQDMAEQPPQVEETGETLLENARRKARAYYEVYHMPVFACDTAIYFDEERFPKESQPGIHTRRALGKVMSDREMIAYYRELVRKYGEVMPTYIISRERASAEDLVAACGYILSAQYKNAVCCYLDEKHVYEDKSSSLWGKSFLLTDRLHSEYQPGFPLDGLSVERGSGISYYDLPDSTRDEIALGKGIQDFFRRILGESRK